MNSLEVILLALVQGLTEFLPVSSSGHLAVGQMLFGISEGNLMLSIVLHMGTLVATLVFFRKSIANILAESSRWVFNPSARTGGTVPVPVYDALAVILASIPTAVIGLGLHDAIDAVTRSLTIVACGFFFTTLLLLATRFHGETTRDYFTPMTAVLVGLAQSVAILPGISRSGATICAALWLGVKAPRAFELSMLISLPAITGAFLLEVTKLEGVPRDVGLLALGCAVAGGSGFLALKWLRALVTKGRLSWFALWVGPLALVSLAIALR